MMKTSARTTPTEWTRDPAVARNVVRILAVDRKRKPVPGACAGDRLSGNYEPNAVIAGKPVDVYWKARRVELPSGQIVLLRFVRSHAVVAADADGVLDIPAQLFSAADPMVQMPRADAIMIVHPERRLGALACCLRDSPGAKTILPLQPLCRVHGHIMRGQADLLPGAKTFACWEPIPGFRMVLAEQFSATEELEMLLPPGQFELESMINVGESRGHIVSLSARRLITIKPGTKELRVNIKLTRKEETIVW